MGALGAFFVGNMTNMETMLKGKKLNMSQLFEKTGRVVPVTLIRIFDGDLPQDLANKPVYITGFSKGKGFTGVMKKWNFSGGQATRGQSDKPRAPGAIGSQTPGRVMRGKKMAGRQGNKQVTVKGLKIVEVYPDKNELAVSGPIPGARNSAVSIRVL
ncbi:MAG: 50S ribosomal protein L3 [candidate division WWE3 bacterium GW2011_GWA1_46_21]|uniref:Large ribosomal subunit protein uL3 n=4 Tax=Katanobacteria TaxID=422282 RepID=A0A0G1SFQ9_UNCKA|nr:MAG: 50S ribosomal protein L3 [candidate division WWE3 bacterium GW2011_GWA1_46_21]KKU48349.1 MAG: 50S ribosomal protein L3 [candidate division WWE3 bacterium GW2011_GWA2_46_9]